MNETPNTTPRERLMAILKGRILTATFGTLEVVLDPHRFAIGVDVSYMRFARGWWVSIQLGCVEVRTIVPRRAKIAPTIVGSIALKVTADTSKLDAELAKAREASER